MLTLLPLIAAVYTLHLAVTGTHRAYHLHKDAQRTTLMAGSFRPDDHTSRATAYSIATQTQSVAIEGFIQAVNGWAATVALLALYALAAR
ncbi:hypothetical protein GCM10017784_35620 [Deinococcus indicus]|uniref:hypothetical protein n=1 Tax=Deinococcus indicus TaxID=223556 RepID=UPI00174E5BDD|nr:hypothetical protein [Deinococcus indicus]GHG37925.1 hypothetical protein GCM10017784_35620 [Deinococcus indicus]